MHAEFRFRDAQGEVHTIWQGDEGEQGDALMPGLFCLALRRSLQEIQDTLPPGEFVFAYLDDIYIVCRPENTHARFLVVQEVLQWVCHINIHLGNLAAWSRM